MDGQPLESAGQVSETRPRSAKKLIRAAGALVLSASALVAGFAFEPKQPTEKVVAKASAPGTQESFYKEINALKLAHRRAEEAEISQAKQAENAANLHNLYMFGLLMNGLQAQQTSMNDQEFLACTRSHESDSAGGYQAVSPDGVYYGAYQFLISTWKNTAVHADRLDLVNVRPDQASPADQDALATDLYHWQGNAPWVGRC